MKKFAIKNLIFFNIYLIVVSTVLLYLHQLIGLDVKNIIGGYVVFAVFFNVFLLVFYKLFKR
jgi:hypothetical protein